MKHHTDNARALPKSVAGEFETLLPAEPAAVHRRAHHADRASLVLSDNPRWIAGSEQAESKYAVATAIRDKYPDGVYLYHRRLINGQTEKIIDILAITSTGVWLIDVEEVTGSAVRFEGKVGLRRSTYKRFMVGGEDYTPVIHDIDSKASQVVEGLGAAGRHGVAVQSVLCLVGRRTTDTALIGGTYVAALPQLLKLMKRGPSKLSAVEVTALGLTVGERFRRPRRNI